MDIMLATRTSDREQRPDHTLRKLNINITRQTLTWNPCGKRERGRQQQNWQHDIEADAGLKICGNLVANATMFSHLLPGFS